MHPTLGSMDMQDEVGGGAFISQNYIQEIKFYLIILLKLNRITCHQHTCHHSAPR